MHQTATRHFIRRLIPRGMKGLACAILAMAALSVGGAHLSNAGEAGNPSPLKLIAFGDSLTAGYNVSPEASFPAQLQAALRRRGYRIDVINAGVSGDTTAAGLSRFDWAVPKQVDAAIVELGANDALRGIDPAETRKNLSRIVAKLHARGAKVLIAGMRAPGNWGKAYAAKFDPIFADIAREHGARLYPFFLDGVALRPDLNLPDGMHPNDKGIAVIVKRILPHVEKLLADITAARG